MTQVRMNATPITPNHALNEIVAAAPQTLPVLQRFGLDTCCGGSLPLHVAAQHHGLDLETVMAALNKVVEQP
jgi:regulator of cell morphogenesis and NO signaling